MDDSSSPPYKVVESPRFARDVKNHFSNFQRWDEIKETIDLDIARNPSIFEKVPSTELYSVGLPTMPPLTLYFSIDLIAKKATIGAINKICLSIPIIGPKAVLFQYDKL